MKNFNESLDGIVESYGLHRTVTRERFPSKLQLSEEFIDAFKREFGLWYRRQHRINRMGLFGSLQK